MRLLTDGGSRYPAACRQLRVEHERIVGGVRPYVERRNRALKHQTRSFDEHHPCSGACDLGHVLRWCVLLVFYCNHVHRHMSGGNRPPLGSRRGRPGSDRGRFLSRHTKAST
ncbi:MAG: hypothetical protein AABX97_02515 [Candidatus Thermoplasmatota archaeon]